MHARAITLATPRVSAAATMLLLLAAILFSGCTRTSSAQQVQPNAFDNSAGSKVDPSADRVARGKYLADIGGCNDCHTPLKMGQNGPEPDMAQYLAGHPAGVQVPPAPKLPAGWLYTGSATNTAYAGPWGVSYAINLTSDQETGIGSWTEATFVASIRSGKHLGMGRPIMPPMPWPAYARMTDEDLRALFAYLQTVPAKRNKVPDAIVAAAPAHTN